MMKKTILSKTLYYMNDIAFPSILRTSRKVYRISRKIGSRYVNGRKPRK